MASDSCYLCCARTCDYTFAVNRELTHCELYMRVVGVVCSLRFHMSDLYFCNSFFLLLLIVLSFFVFVSRSLPHHSNIFAKRFLLLLLFVRCCFGCFFSYYFFVCILYMVYLNFICLYNEYIYTYILRRHSKTFFFFESLIGFTWIVESVRLACVPVAVYVFCYCVSSRSVLRLGIYSKFSSLYIYSYEKKKCIILVV